MPKYTKNQTFLREYISLRADQRLAFMTAVKQHIIDLLNAGQWPNPKVFHKLSGYNLYEFRWDMAGGLRATGAITSDATGTIVVEWRRIGDHHIYDQP
jgi:hypothetical protein